jgi:hypothetical protein
MSLVTKVSAQTQDPFLASVPGFVGGSHLAIRSQLWVGLGVAKIGADHHFNHQRGLKMGSAAKYSPIVVTLAHADVTNLTLILDFGPILAPWFEVCYFIFGPSLDWILARFQRSFELFCNLIQALPPVLDRWPHPHQT